MYDFYFDKKHKIKKNPEDFLIFVKKLLPRWLNGIPDSECLAIYKTLDYIKKKKKKKLVVIETGCGASTLALFLHSALNGNKMFSWDINGSKGSILKSIINEAICNAIEVDINKVWTFVPFFSTDRHVGLNMLKDMRLKADFCFFDSWHTLDHVISEIKEYEKISPKDNFVLAFDDSYYTKKKLNYVYINIIRTKLGLKKVEEPSHNISRPFYIEIENYLKRKYKKVIKLRDYYKSNYKKDEWFRYYKEVKDFGISSYKKKFSLKDLKVKKSTIIHRFDAFEVKK